MELLKFVTFATGTDTGGVNDPQESVAECSSEYGTTVDPASPKSEATMPLSPLGEAPVQELATPGPSVTGGDTVSIDPSSVQANIKVVDISSDEEDSILTVRNKKQKTEEVPSTPSKEIQRADTSEGKGKEKEGSPPSEGKGKEKEGSPPSKKGGDSASEDQGDPHPPGNSPSPDEGGGLFGEGFDFCF